MTDNEDDDENDDADFENEEIYSDIEYQADRIWDRFRSEMQLDLSKYTSPKELEDELNRFFDGTKFRNLKSRGRQLVKNIAIKEWKAKTESKEPVPIAEPITLPVEKPIEIIPIPAIEPKPIVEPEPKEEPAIIKESLFQRIKEWIHRIYSKIVYSK
jgi:hypothetical protein